MSNYIETEYISWSKAHFNMLALGGIWMVPRSGLMFEKTEDGLLLKDRMPWTPEMPITKERLEKYQDDDYADIKRNFEAAGISVFRAEA